MPRSGSHGERYCCIPDEDHQSCAPPTRPPPCTSPHGQLAARMAVATAKKTALQETSLPLLFVPLIFLFFASNLSALALFAAGYLQPSGLRQKGRRVVFFSRRHRTRFQNLGQATYLCRKKTSALAFGLSIYVSKKRAPHFFF